MNTATISMKNQITIPARIIKLWEIGKTNRQIVWDIIDRGKDQLLVIKPKSKSAVNEFAGIAKGLFNDAGGSGSYLKTERESWN